MVEIYRRAQEKYRPEQVRVLFMAESTPAYEVKPRYFYFEDVQAGDSLFKETMMALYPDEFKNYNRQPKLKRHFLKKFQMDGYFLIDAVEFPINGSDRKRKKLIIEHKEELLQKLFRICSRVTKILLIKKNIYELLNFDLKSIGFKVLNDGPIPFPLYQHRQKYREKLIELLSVSKGD